MDRRFKILSLDGGGIRGYLTLLILKQMEDYLNEQDKGLKQKPLGKRFHLISGTSTGAIIATLLAEGYYVDKIIELYKDLIPVIFKKPSFLPNFLTKYDSQTLQSEADKIWGNKTFNNLKVDVLIPTVDLASARSKIYKSFTNSQEQLSNVIVASASAPTYFKPSTKLSSSFASIDGGLVANNPTLLALITYLNYSGSYKNYTSNLEQEICNTIIVSVGTGLNQKPDFDPVSLTKWKKGKWLWAKSIIHLLFESQIRLVDEQVEMLMESSNNLSSYKRINPILTQRIDLDEIDKLDLLPSFVEDIDKSFFKTYF